MKATCDNYWDKLQKILRSAAMDKGLAIAFSGGLDSRFLTHAALLLNLEVLALHFGGPHVQREQENAALAWLGQRREHFPRLRADSGKINPLLLPQVRFNGQDRCYHCKTAAFGKLKALSGERALCDGTLYSDFQEYRPGRKALEEMGVRSPLAEAGMDKAAVRELGLALGLDNVEQASQTCLLTRFDYGLETSGENLTLLENAENDINDILQKWRDRSQKATLKTIPDEFRLRFLYLADSASRAELHLKTPPGLLKCFPVLSEAGSEELPLDLDEAALSGQKENCLAARNILGKNLIEELERVLSAHGLSGAPMRLLVRLSGFFDRRLGLS